jgi:hypothetical protein
MDLIDSKWLNYKDQLDRLIKSEFFESILQSLVLRNPLGLVWWYWPVT